MSIYSWMALAVLAIFYGIYFVKMLIQKQHGIRTHHIGTRKEKSISRVETLMSAATLGIVIVQLASIILDWSLMPPDARFTGFLLALLGDLIFLISVCTMKDSWRAGIPEQDETEFVTGGIYRFSRNPAFLGFDFMYVGVLLLFFNPLLLAFTVFAAVMLHLQILQEEKFLTERFGEQYIEYKGRVFRYLGNKKR